MSAGFSLRGSGRSTDLFEIGAMIALLVVTIALFSALLPGFLSPEVFRSMAFQMPELGLLTLAMLLPIISGGLNLAVTYTANVTGLIAAWIVIYFGGDANWIVVVLAMVAAIASGALVGGSIGAMVARLGAHPILVTLGFMILLRGLGEWFTRGGDISGMPPVFTFIGHGTVLGIPMPLLVFALAVITWIVVLQYTGLGLSIYMVGSNPRAARYSGINVARVMVLVYALSGMMSAVAGLIMLSRFNSVRIGHGDSYLLITILACFLAGANPFGGSGRVLPVAIGLFALQVIGSGLNLMGVSQHLTTAAWGLFLILVMAMRARFQRRR